MTTKCPVCRREMPIHRKACSRECQKKVLLSGLFPEKTEEAKLKRRLDVIARREG